MSPSPIFVRVAVAGGPVVRSSCPKCGKAIAWSRRREVLRIAERAHQCRAARPKLAFERSA